MVNEGVVMGAVRIVSLQRSLNRILCRNLSHVSGHIEFYHNQFSDETRHFL